MATTNLVAKVLLPGMSTPHVLASSAFYTCTTEAATAAKTIADVDFTLVAGMTITVKFANTNTAQNPTLAINGGSAIPINLTAYAPAGVTPSTSWDPGAVISMTYDGTSWIMNDFPVWVTGILKENDAMIYKGTYTATSTQTIDANAFSVDPTLETDARGWTYKVTGVTSTNKYFGTETVENGDIIIVNTDNAPSTTQSNYDVIQTNIDMEALAHQHYYTPSGTITTSANSGSDAIYTPSGYINTPTITVTETSTHLSATATQGQVTETDTMLSASATATQGKVTETSTHLSATATQGVVTPSTTNVLTGVSIAASASTSGDVVTDITTTTDSVTWSVNVNDGVMSFAWGGNKTLVDSVSTTMGDIATTDADVLDNITVADPTVTIAGGATGDVEVLNGVSVADPTVSVTLANGTTGDVTVLTGVAVADPTVTIAGGATGDVEVLNGATAALDENIVFSGDGVDITFTGTRDQTEPAL